MSAFSCAGDKQKESVESSSDVSDYLSFSSDEESDYDFDKSKFKSSPKKQGGVVRQENDIVISLTDEQYKLIITPEIDRLVDKREKGSKLDVTERADEVLSIMREILQKQGGSYLQLKKNPIRYEKIDEKQAREKIKTDLAQESRKLFLRRSTNTDLATTNESATKAKSPVHAPETKKRSADAAEAATEAKKSKVDGDAWGVRPKRATQQLRDDMPLKEILENTANPIGRDVIGYTVNPSFKLKRIKTGDDKVYCIGQMISNELIKSKGHKWALKHCELDGKWEFVAFKDCNNLNSQMEDALKGNTRNQAFVGYGKLAEFALQNGLLETEIKDPQEIKDMMKKLGMAVPAVMNKNDTEGAVASFMQPDAEKGQLKLIHTAKNKSPRPTLGDTSKVSAAVPKSVVSTSVPKQHGMLGGISRHHADMTVMKNFNELHQMDERIRVHMKSITTKFSPNSDKFTKSVAFYSGLRSWLATSSGDQEFIATFDADEIQVIMDEFEHVMKKLAVAKDTGDAVGVTLHHNLIEFLIKRFR